MPDSNNQVDCGNTTGYNITFVINNHPFAITYPQYPPCVAILFSFM